MKSATCLSLLVLAAAADAQTTALTYQGRLKNGAQAASGLHDFRFRLFDAASGGTPIGTLQCADNVPVTGGLFTAPIDFGQQYNTAAPRFLEIEVRADTGLTCATSSGFVTLGPRQPLTATPLASHAKSASALSAADGSPESAVFVDGDGRVGVGTTSPGGRLDIQASNNSNVLFGRRSGGGLAHNLYIDSAGNGSLQLLDSASAPRVEFANGLTYFNYGNVGIGTPNPLAKLDVRGDIRLGASGEMLGTGGHEPLRIIRGYVNSNGGPAFGSGFSPTHPLVGEYTIVFDTPFSSIPTFTASCVFVNGQPPVTALPNSLSTTSVTIVLLNPSGAKVDRAFHFIAVARP